MKSPHLLALLGLAFVVIATFHSVLLPPKPLMASDSPTASVALGRQRLLEGQKIVWNTDGYLGRGGGVLTLNACTPLQILVPPRYYNTVLFPLCVFLVGVGMYLFCLSLGLSSLSGFAGACALMLSGDFITATFSGHGGKFIMWVFLLFALWLLTVAIHKRSLLAFLWCGICSGIGISNQLDIGFIVALCLAAWAIFLVWQTRGDARRGRLAAGFAIAAVAVFIYSSRMVVSLLGLANQGQGNLAPEERSPAEQWNWATQWSLPKAETLTLVMPGFFGFGDPLGSPYWGSIGRDARWPPQGFARFSMSTQGIGVATVALALLAIFAGAAPGSPRRPLIVFWAVTAVVALMFAYGRYLDLSPTGASGFGPYRVFYWLPKMSSMRNPLKFLYPFALAVATLAAFGMAFLHRDAVMGLRLPGDPRFKRFLVAWAFLVGLMVFIAGVACVSETAIMRSTAKARTEEMMFLPQVQQMLAQGSTREQLKSRIEQDYTWPEADTIVQNMKTAALRATSIALLITVVLYLALTARRLQDNERMVVAGAVIILLLMDLGYVAHKYILPENTALTLDKTGAIVKLEQVARPFRVSVLSRSGIYNTLVGSLFSLYGIECIDVPADSRPTPDRAAFFYSDALSPLRRWQYSNVRFVLAPKNVMDSAIRQFGARGQLVPFHEYDENNQPQVICEFTAALPRVFAVGSWVVNTNAHDVLAFMNDPANDPRQAAVVCDMAVAPRSVSNFSSSAVATNYTFERIEANVHLSQHGLVVMATEPDPGWTVTVDGAEKPLVRCNLLHQGVFVPAGTHSVVFSFYTNHWTNVLNDWAYRALPVLLAATAALGAAAWRRRVATRPDHRD